MSRTIVYKCDQCKKEIGAKAHITLLLNSNGPGTGIAVPPANGNMWRTARLPLNFMQFHDGKCIGAYFDSAIKKATEKNQAKA